MNHPLTDQDKWRIVAALLSLFVPGLGQAIQGRFGAAILFFIGTCVLWWFLLGWVIHIWAVIDAFLYDDGSEPKA